MAATSDGELESLILNFEQIYKDYRDGIAQIQILKINCSAEIRRREALETTCNDLRKDNERLTKMYTESLTKLADQLEYHTKYQSLKKELKEVKDRHLVEEDENKRIIERLKQENLMKIGDLEKQVRSYFLQQSACEATVDQLQQELSEQKAQMDILNNSLERVNVDFELKYQDEIQDLKDWLQLEQVAKSELSKQLQSTEKELLMSKTMQVEEKRESTSNHHMEILKHKIMKLRRENEDLKRQLHQLQF